MNLIRGAIERPIAVISAVLMIVMFGLVALQSIPIQLSPDVNRPVITITTVWGGAAPAEVEREVVNRQEEVMAGLEGLETISSRAEPGRSRITLEFRVGANMDRALLLVSNRLDRVSGYPEEVDEPILDTAGSEDNAIAWFIVTRAEGNERPVHEFGDFVEDVVKDRIERVKGVSRVNVFGGGEREIQVTIDPQLQARYGLTVSDMTRALRAANASMSAGDVEEGKRRYVVRTEGELNSLDEAGHRRWTETGGRELRDPSDLRISLDGHRHRRERPRGRIGAEPETLAGSTPGPWAVSLVPLRHSPPARVPLPGVRGDVVGRGDQRSVMSDGIGATGRPRSRNPHRRVAWASSACPCPADLRWLPHGQTSLPMPPDRQSEYQHTAISDQ